jgi:hypothetical protein
MTLGERVEMHEQWLSSMESHHARLAEDLGRLEHNLANYQKTFAEHMATVVMQMGAFATALARLTTEVEEGHLHLQQEIRELRELVERYIRFRGNGNPPGN